MIGADVYLSIGSVGKVGIFQMRLIKECAFELRRREVGILEQGRAKVHLFGAARFHHKPLHIKPEKVTVIQDAFGKSQRQRIEQAFPVCHAPVDAVHLAGEKLRMAYLGIGQFHHT